MGKRSRREGIAVRTVALAPVLCFAGSLMAGTITPQPRMGEPLPGLTPEQLALFNAGRVAYNKPLAVADGLGPVFNKSSCGNCHNNPVGGTGSISVTRFGTVNKGVFDPLDALGGSLLQVSGISDTCLEVIPKEATIVTPRITNGMMGYGLVEAIPDSALLANRDAQLTDIKGVAHMVSAFEDDPKTPPNSHVGRFGWKAQVPTMLTFAADAALNEMGLTNRFILGENAPNGNEVLLAECDAVADPEDSADQDGFEFIDRVTHFQRYLGFAPQTPKSGMTGETIFNNLRCGECHTASFTTSNDAGLEDAIRNKTIRPYSDFLLHQMGQSGDPIHQGAGEPGMVKTPPLWGLRVRTPIWHNGSIADEDFPTRMNAAILLHDDGNNQSQGRFSVALYNNLSAQEKNRLYDFLFSLGRMEFDHDVTLENQIDLFDFLGLAECYTGAGVSYAGKGENPMDLPCAVSDIDQDSDVDLDDFQSFLLAYVGPRRDCNGNGLIDLQDILVGGEIDLNLNGIPDSCEPTCDADVNGDAGIDVDDLLAVINQWGSCPALTLPCSADFNIDQVVDVDDLLTVINAWGVCQ
jgi:CxxC motif-containing protein (DUF1111 family)